jgi:hypothetical protein
VLPARLVLLASLALTAPAAARGEADAELEARLTLHSRVSSLQREPAADVRFDPTTLTFGVWRYLAPAPTQGGASGLLDAELTGRRGAWRWAVLADSGEVQQRSSPGAVAVCASNQAAAAHPGGSPTGLALVGSGACNGPGQPGLPRGRWVLPSSLDQPPAWTSNGRTLATEAGRTWFLREAWLGLEAGPNGFAFLRAGRHRFTVGDAFVYDDYGLGAEVQLDLGAIGPSWQVGAALFWPTRDWPSGTELRSPMLALRVDRLLGLFEHVGLFLALALDRTGGVAELFRGAEVESSVFRLRGLPVGTAAYQDEAQRLARVLSLPLDGRAALGWVGVSGRLEVTGLDRLAFTGAASLGTVVLAAGGVAEVKASVLGGMATATWDHRLGREVVVGVGGLVISGDVAPPERARLGLPQRYGGFLGTAPWITATNLFFSGGLSETFAARQATAPGVNGRGVLAPLLRATWEPSAALRLDLKGAWLAAPEPGPLGGRVYGPELDLGLRWAPLAWLTVSAEADQLWPGDFFGGGPPVRKLILGLDLSTP